MASWNRVTAGDTLWDARRVRDGVRNVVGTWPVKVISMDSVTETAVVSWNHNPARTINRKQLEKYRAKRPDAEPAGTTSRVGNRGRSTTGEAAVPYYIGSPQKEAAKHLRLTAARFLDDRATVSDVDEAVKVWAEATRKEAGHGTR